MKLWSIQILRFVAALLVVHSHAINDVDYFVHRYGVVGPPGMLLGRCGVDIFFVISGFIITRTGRGLTWRQFAAKRAQRVLPLYYTFAAACTLIVVAGAGLDWRTGVATWLLWPATDRMTFPLGSVTWTLCFEALFYAAFALCIWRKAALPIVFAVFFACLLLRPFGAVFQFAGCPLIFEFLAGVALAYAPPWRPAIFAIPIGAAIFVVGAALQWPTTGQIMSWMASDGAWIRVADLGVPAVLVVWGTLQLRAEEGVLTRLGDASYALYLVHLPIVNVVVRALTPLAARAPDAVIVIAMGASVLISWVVHRFYEKPLMAWLRRRSRPPPAPAAAQSPSS